MGTSASVSGAGPGVPLVPDWVEDIDGIEPSHDEPQENIDGDDSTEDKSSDEETQEDPPKIPLTPKRRLKTARQEMGKFASEGDRSNLRRGVGNYIRSGRGGTAMAVRRSGGSARRGASLGGIVSGGPAFGDIRERIREAIASSGDPAMLLAAIAAAASPNDGTLDSETGQRAASEALQHVLEMNPEADLLNLNPSERETLLERFLAIDCYELFMTEVGKHIQSKVELSEAIDRISEIKNYFCETFRQANQRRTAINATSLGRASDTQLNSVCREVIADAYFTFEAYLDGN